MNATFCSKQRVECNNGRILHTVRNKLPSFYGTQCIYTNYFCNIHSCDTTADLQLIALKPQVQTKHSRALSAIYTNLTYFLNSNTK